MKTLIKKLKALFCLHKWGETICGGIHYSYRNCEKCGKQQNNGSTWD